MYSPCEVLPVGFDQAITAQAGEFLAVIEAADAGRHDLDVSILGFAIVGDASGSAGAGV